LNRINKFCSRCQKFDGAPSRFKFTLRDNDIDFNHSIFVDIMYLDGSPVLHVVDEATRFQAARWLPSMAAQHVWESLRTCWIDVYLGPPDLINHDAGTNFTYHNHHSSRLGMKQSTYDPCLLFTSNDSAQGQGIVGLQTDDTLIVCDSKFKDKESVELKNAGFLAKPREQLTTDHPIMFNGVLVTKETSPPVITITQSKQIQKITPIPLDSITREKYVAQRARGAYISVCHPQVAFGLSHTAQSTDPIPSKDDVNQLNKCL
jgi:hypothetical protein